MNDTDNCDNRLPPQEGSACTTPNCLIEFDGYWWWTNYPFNIANSGYWFNNQQWDPRLAFVDSDGLHLQMKQTLLPNAPGEQWSSVEVLLWAPSSGGDGSNPPARFYPGFGTYLVAASTAGSFNDLANNCCFGAFTYRFDADGSQTNQHHELDMIECSRFGRTTDPTNAQFTLQPWGAGPDNVHRITLQDAGEITLVMHWQGPAQPVTFDLYYGIHALESLPGSPDITWTTSPSQNVYIPTDACQTVHLNLWREPQYVIPSGDQEVVVKRFQYVAAG